MANEPIKPIAIYLPQFHPIRENNMWWGEGFTEWRNVVKAAPLFNGHYQPHLPADLGFYDLRVHETREAQTELARQYGIHGFCYYHYWFNGKRLLNRPLDDMLKTKSPNFPYLLCWANENWTRRWDGMDHQVLMVQDYNTMDDEAHMRFLCDNFFKDQRYIRVNNKPFFIVYRPSLIPDINRTLDTWRTVALKSGIGELFLGYMQTKKCGIELTNSGFDCAIEFQPDFHDLSPRMVDTRINRIFHRLHINKSIYRQHRVIDYSEYVRKMIMERDFVPGVFPGITPMWDNSARRREGATIFKNSEPDLFREWFNHIIQHYKQKEGDRFIFINAWNEWAEGNHLEPCEKWGHQYLQAIKSVLNA